MSNYSNITTFKSKSQEFLQKEIEASAIDPALAKLNMFPWSGENEDDVETVFTGLYPLKATKSLQCKRRHRLDCTHGWYAMTLDPLNPLDPPQFYRARFADNEKPKYLCPATGQGNGWKLGFFQVTLEIWQRIADKHGAPFNPAIDTDFWVWVKSTGIPIMLTEDGSKKTLALMTAGYAVIALPGIYMGRYRHKKGFLYLHPQLANFAGTNQFITCFDTETKETTAQQVQKAKSQLEFVLNDYGVKLHDVTLPLLPNTKKTGVDDFLAAKSVSEFDYLFLNKTESPGKLKLKLDMRSKLRARRAYTATVPTDDFLKTIPQLLPNIQKIVAKGETPLIALKGLQGARKSVAGRQLIAALNMAVVSLGCTNGLQFSQVEKLQNLGVDISHIHELKKGETNQSDLVILNDPNCSVASALASLHCIYPAAFDGKVVWFDESEENLQELVNGNTCSKYREQILGNFIGGLERAGCIILAQAELTDRTVDTVAFLADIKPENILQIESSFVPPLKKINYHLGTQEIGEDLKSTDISPLIKLIIKKLKCALQQPQNERKALYIGSDCLTFLQALKRLIDAEIPDLRVLEVNSETRGDFRIVDRHPETGKITGGLLHNPTLYLVENKIDLLMTSPTFSTGNSVENEGYFSDIFYFGFHLSPTKICQSLNRVREDVPVHLWVAPFAFFAQNGEDVSGFTAKNIMDSAWLQKQLNASFLGFNGPFMEAKTRWKRSEKRAALSFYAAENLEELKFEKAYLREQVLLELQANGNEVKETVVYLDPEDETQTEEIKELGGLNETLKQKRIEVKKTYGFNIFNAPKKIEKKGEIVDLDYETAAQLIENGCSDMEKVYSAKKVMFEVDFLGNKNPQDDIEHKFYTAALLATFYKSASRSFKSVANKIDLQNLDKIIERERVETRSKVIKEKYQLDPIVTEKRRNLALWQVLKNDPVFMSIVNGEKTEGFKSEDFTELGKKINSAKGEKRKPTNSVNTCLQKFGLKLVEKSVRIDASTVEKTYIVVNAAKDAIERGLRQSLGQITQVTFVTNYPGYFDWIVEKVIESREKFYNSQIQTGPETQIFSKKAKSVVCVSLADSSVSNDSNDSNDSSISNDSNDSNDSSISNDSNDSSIASVSTLDTLQIGDKISWSNETKTDFYLMVGLVQKVENNFVTFISTSTNKSYTKPVKQVKVLARC